MCNRKFKRKYKSTSDRNRWQSSYIIVPYWADVKSLILVEIGVFADEESLLHSSFEPVFLSVDDSAAFPVNPVVFLNGVLCYTWSLNFSISAVPSVFWQSGSKSPASFPHIWVVTVLTRNAVDDSCYIIWVYLLWVSDCCPEQLDPLYRGRDPVLPTPLKVTKRTTCCNLPCI